MPRTPTKEERNALIMKLHDEGLSMYEIPERLVEVGYVRITPPRVWAIIRQEKKRREKQSD